MDFVALMDLLRGAGVREDLAVFAFLCAVATRQMLFPFVKIAHFGGRAIPKEAHSIVVMAVLFVVGIVFGLAAKVPLVHAVSASSTAGFVAMTLYNATKARSAPPQE